MNIYKILTTLILAATLVGCSKDGGGGGGGSPAPSGPKPPRNLTYESTTFNFENQVEITPKYPTYYGTLATSFSISPNLPAGLQFSELSGRIAGTPEALDVSPRTYTITASNANGSTSTQISISVKAQAPFGLRYTSENVVMQFGTRQDLYPTHNPGIRGGAAITSYSLNPSTLPAGLVFDPATGSITGSPTTNSGATVYTLTGTNSGGSTTATITISVVSDVLSLALGGKHSCAISNKRVKCWGDNTYGQLGDGTNNLSLVAKTVSGLNNVEQDSYLSAGSDYTCAINRNDIDYNMYCWGRNHSGQLGPNISGDKNSPTLALSSVGNAIEGVSASLYGYGSTNSANTCYRGVGGVPYCWGAFPNGNLSSSSYEVRDVSNNPFSGILSLISGGTFACLNTNSSVYCLGANNKGQLNTGNTTSSLLALDTGLPGSGTKVKAGREFACALDLSGFSCWGDNSSNQLGSASFFSSYSADPVTVEGLASTPLDFALGKDHGCAIVESSNRKVMCWGANSHGQLGRGTIVVGGSSNIPQYVVKEDDSQLTGVSKIFSGEDHTCVTAINETTSGTDIYCWGKNDSGQLGTSGGDSGKAKKINQISLGI